MADEINSCLQCSSAPECSDIPVIRTEEEWSNPPTGEACTTYEPECPEGGTRTAGIPEYTMTVRNLVVGE